MKIRLWDDELLCGRTDGQWLCAILRTRLNTSQLMLYKEIIAIFFPEIHKQHITTLCEQKVEF